MNQSLVLSGISKRFCSDRGGTVEALRDVTLTVPTGRITVLLGPSGCGKSTLLQLIAGFETPDSGRMEQGGRPFSPEGTGMVFQSPALFSWLTVEQNVAFGLKRRKVPALQRKQLVSDMINRVGLTGFEQVYPHELSGGMQQRTALARVLVLQPDLLLMDEPFAALDAQLRERMQALLLELWAQRRQTILFVTHDVEEALRIAHQVVVFTARPGTVEKVLELPSAPGSRDLTSSALTDCRTEIRAALNASSVHQPRP